ncbi:branched-chain amino acid transport [Geoglobus ahangari]|uniref:Branched-chain amino acid transport n=1 Tax=Geoglobus ahangari TaxID=113653 RepID=A0A0F7IC87_9EURY|nr:AzlD domain-containing protein [Geoglobus ahangari]AKG90845.1 branched-chain amino acid transport [Geoglobus ahangari]
MDWLILILGMAVVTYLTRVTPFFLSIRDSRFVKYVPPAVFSALVFPDVLSSPEKTIAGALVFAVCIKNRDLLLAFLVGTSALYVLQLV